MSDRLRHRFEYRGRHWLFAALLTCGAGETAAHQFSSPGVFHRPAPTSVTLSDPAVGDTYTQGETITATVAWDTTVRLNQGCTFNNGWGLVKLRVQIGSVVRLFSCPGGSDVTSVVFSYTVQQDDVDADGVSISGRALIGRIGHVLVH